MYPNPRFPARGALGPLLLWLAVAGAPAAQLVLPGKGKPKQPPAASAPAKPEARTPKSERSPDEPASPEAGDAGGGDSVRAARAIIERLRKDGRVDFAAAAAASLDLAQLGAPGFEAARVALADEHPAVLVAGARALTHTGSTVDRQRVLSRLTGSLPGAAAAPLFAAVEETAPEWLTPDLLASMLEHPQGALRSAADRALRRQLGPDLVPALERVLFSGRTDARVRATALLAEINAPRAFELVLARLRDGAPQVSYRAAESLAGSRDPRATPMLIQIAFGARPMRRDGAYAALALVLRGERTGEHAIDATRAEVLCDALRSTDALVASAAAIALADLGFAHPSPSETAWLDRDVPHQLVRVLAAEEFLPELSVLRGPASSRLELLSGAGHGLDGPAWRTWWVASESNFRARRAVLELPPEDTGRLELRYHSLGEGEWFALRGPDVPPAADDAGDVYYLSSRGASELASELAAQGMLGAERTPGIQKSAGGSARVLEIRVGDQAKIFGFGARAEPWFEVATSQVLGQVDRLAWQRLRDPLQHPDPRAFALEEMSWWEGAERSELESAHRTKALALAALDAGNAGVAEAALAECERVYRTDGAPEPADLDALTAAIARTPGDSPRLARLVALALVAAAPLPALPLPPPPALPPPAPQAPADASVPAGVSVPILPAETARALIEALLAPIASAGEPDASRSISASEPIRASETAGASESPIASESPGASERIRLAADVLARAPLDTALALALDERPSARAAAASRIGAALASPTGAGGALATGTDAEAASTALERLLADADVSVEIAAVRAAGDAHLESARAALLLRARHGRSVELRAAALQAVGQVGGPGALEALLEGISSRDATLEAAAASGLASLGDPAAARLLVSLLGRGPGALVYHHARDGLLRLGESAKPDLLRAATSSAHGSRRAAALLLARMGAPEAFSAMIRLLAENPTDGELASELAVLTCHDAREQADPEQSWWNWWDGVAHGDARAWFLSAAARLDLAVPGAETIAPPGTLQGASFLVAVLEREESWLVERARRDLGALLGHDLGVVPIRGAARAAWIEALRAEVERKYAP